MAKRLSMYLKALIFTIASFTIIPAFSTPDLTIVGFFDSADGIGKVSLTILETLGNDISINFVGTMPQPNMGKEITSRATECINNPDHEAGKVALLTELLWSRGSKPSDKMPKDSIVKLAYSMLETTKIPSTWVKILNEEFDAVVVPDIYVSKLYKNSGVHIPIFVLPLPMILDPYYARTPHANTPSKPFIFADTSANKNPTTLIKAFAKAFRNNPDVVLFLRAGILNAAPIEAAINKYHLNTVIFESGKIPLSQFIDRLLNADCYVNLSYGEGFSYIPRECLALGLPVIVTNNTASGTICKSGYVRAVPSTKRTSTSPHLKELFFLFGEDCGEQFDCEVDDVVAALKDVYSNYSKYIEKAKKGREWVRQYDCKNPKLQALYRTLIKPKRVILGSKNLLTEDALITDSKELYQKYLKVSKS